MRLVLNRSCQVINIVFKRNYVVLWIKINKMWYPVSINLVHIYITVWTNLWYISPVYLFKSLYIIVNCSMKWIELEMGQLKWKFNFISL